MTLGHFIYIPLVLLFGLVVGHTLGRKSAEREAAEHNARAQASGTTRRRRRRRASATDEDDASE